MVDELKPSEIGNGIMYSTLVSYLADCHSKKFEPDPERYRILRELSLDDGVDMERLAEIDVAAGKLGLISSNERKPLIYMVDDEPDFPNYLRPKFEEAGLEVEYYEHPKYASDALMRLKENEMPLPKGLLLDLCYMNEREVNGGNEIFDRNTVPKFYSTFKRIYFPRIPNVQVMTSTLSYHDLELLKSLGIDYHRAYKKGDLIVRNGKERLKELIAGLKGEG
ncbi:MAG: hypothetical protein WC796_06090 [Candidatus Pacearchaeota archaeon]|jgi:hypothetical protein